MPTDDPRQLRPDRTRRLAVIAASVICAVLLLVVVLNMEDRVPDDGPPAGEVTELLPPPGMLPEIGADPLATPEFDVGGGGWIQVADEDGRLAQQYRFDQMDPNPDGSFTMENPEAEVRLGERRVLTFTGDRAIVRAPRRRLESGTVTGEVVIRVYEIEPFRLDRRTEPPIAIVRTSDAEFDHILGEVRCREAVRVETAQAVLTGRDLQVAINDRDRRAEYLALGTVESVRIASFDIPGAETETETETVRERERPRRARPRRDTDEPRRDAREPGRKARRDGREGRDRPDRRASADGADATFYRLTLHDDVVVTRGSARARGDRLEVVFSPEGEGLGDIVALGSPPTATLRGTAAGRTGPLATLLTRLALAGVQDGESVAPPEGDDDIIVTCRGGLTMVPIDETAERPASPDDARLDLHGAPVLVDDPERDARVRCAILRYRSRDGRIEFIEGTEPVAIESGALIASAALAWLNVEATLGGFVGAGWIESRPRPEQDAPPGPETTDDLVEELRITWEDSVDLAFTDASGAAADPQEAASRLTSAEFAGNVNVTSATFDLRADRMDVAFDPELGGESDVREIAAEGSVHVRSLDPTEPGDLAGRSLLLVLGRDDEGRTSPERLFAAGGVRASDSLQTIWAGSVDVTFMPAVETETDGTARAQAAPATEVAAAPPAPEDAAARPSSITSRMGGLDVRTFLARDGVEVRMERGTRIFADEMAGDGIERQLVLTGDEVRIFDGRNVFDRGRRLVLDEREQSGRVEGPGQFRMFSRPVIEDRPGERLEVPPVIETDPSVRIRWNDSMRYDGLVNAGAGAAEFAGDVDAFVEPAPSEEQRFSGHRLRLELEHGPPPVEPAIEAPAEADLGAPLGDDRRIARMIATGAARIEATTWPDAARATEPRVFFVAGDLIDYDNRNGSAEVTGAGEMLLHDPTPEDAAAGDPAPAAASDSAVALSGRGSTAFAWNDGLSLRPLVDDLDRVEIRGGVQMRHRAPDGRLATVTCGRLEADMRRGRDRAAADTEHDFGGSADLTRVRAESAVVVDTPQREVRCDFFDYDAERSVAEIRARPGRRASVAIRGNPNLVTFERAVWSLSDGRMVIDSSAGG